MTFQEQWQRIQAIGFYDWLIGVVIISSVIMFFVAIHYLLKLVSYLVYRKEIKRQKRLDYIMNNPKRKYYIDPETLKTQFETQIFVCYNEDGTKSYHEYTVKDNRK